MASNKTISSIHVGRRDTYLLPLDKITIDKTFNVRDDFGDIEGLAKDIAQNGLHYPLKVRVNEGVVVLVDGHRRYMAIQYAREHFKTPIDSVYCLTENKGSNEETRLLEMFSTGTHTKPLTSLEQARVFKRLIDLNWTVARIVEQTGFGEQKVRALLDLNEATPELRQAVAEEQISTSAATTLARQPEEDQRKVIKRSRGKRVKVEDVHRLTVGKVYTLSTTKVEHYLEKANEAVKTRKAKGRPVEFLLGLRYGLMVAVGKKKFSLSAAKV